MSGSPSLEHKEAEGEGAVLEPVAVQLLQQQRGGGAQYGRGTMKWTAAGRGRGLLGFVLGVTVMLTKCGMAVDLKGLNRHRNHYYTLQVY